MLLVKFLFAQLPVGPRSVMMRWLCSDLDYFIAYTRKKNFAKTRCRLKKPEKRCEVVYLNFCFLLIYCLWRETRNGKQSVFESSGLNVFDFEKKTAMAR